MANSQTILFDPNVDERGLDQEVDEVNDRLAGVGEDIPVSFDGDGMDGLMPSGGGGDGGGVPGGGAAGGAALASKIPKSVAGVTSAAALPVALTGAAGLGILDAMRSNSARLQTSTSILSQAWTNIWRPIGDKVDQLFIRDMAMDILAVTERFENAFRNVDWLVDPLMRTLGGFLDPINGGFAGMGQQAAEEIGRAVEDIRWGRHIPDFDWPTLPEFDWPSLPSFRWPTLPDFSWPSLPSFSWPTLPQFSWPTVSAPDWSGLNPDMPDWSNVDSGLNDAIDGFIDGVNGFVGWVNGLPVGINVDPVGGGNGDDEGGGGNGGSGNGDTGGTDGNGDTGPTEPAGPGWWIDGDPIPRDTGPTEPAGPGGHLPGGGPDDDDGDTTPTEPAGPGGHLPGGGPNDSPGDGRDRDIQPPEDPWWDTGAPGPGDDRNTVGSMSTGTDEVVSKLDETNRRLKRVEEAAATTASIGDEQIAKSASNGKRNHLADSDPRI